MAALPWPAPRSSAYGPAVTRDERLALAPVPDRETDLLRAAAVSAGLATVDLPARWWQWAQEHDDGVTAWRVPTGAAALSAWQGWPLPLAVAPPSWLARRDPDLLGGRRLAVVTAADVLAGRLPFDLRALKPASLKVRGLPAQRVAGTPAAQALAAAAALPAEFALLVADGWLECHSEYRTFCVGRDVVTASPYRIEDEGWSAELWLHRASWHEQAAQLAADLLADLPEDDVPPACVLDVARLDDGRLAVLETNTAWAAGLYGCDPDAVLRAVLAAQRPADPRWVFDPGVPLTPAAAQDDVPGSPVTPPSPGASVCR